MGKEKNTKNKEKRKEDDAVTLEKSKKRHKGGP